MMIREACVENFTNVPEVIARGAERIELCDNLAVGGHHGECWCCRYCNPLLSP